MKWTPFKTSNREFSISKLDKLLEKHFEAFFPVQDGKVRFPIVEATRELPDWKLLCATLNKTPSTA